jgi:2-haloacid dehalogenase
VTYDAVAFDLYGTLLDTRSLEAAAAGVTDDPAALGELWRRTQLRYTWLRSLMARYEDFWSVTSAALEHAADQLGIGLDASDRQRLMDAWLALRPFPDVGPGLERLAATGRTLAVLSNGTSAMIERPLRAAGLVGAFAHVLSADRVRIYKPAAAVYELADAACSLPRDRILFVSSNGWDVAGAAAFGLPTAWVNRGAGAPERLDAGPTLTVDDLVALAEALAG